MIVLIEVMGIYREEMRVTGIKHGQTNASNMKYLISF